MVSSFEIGIDSFSLALELHSLLAFELCDRVTCVCFCKDYTVLPRLRFLLADLVELA